MDTVLTIGQGRVMGNLFNARKSIPAKQKRNIHCKPLALAIAVAFSGSLPNIANAATYMVTSTADSGPGSLREAIGFANGTTPNQADTIEFDINDVPPGSTITLTTGEIAVTDTLTITGPTVNDAGSIIIDGNESSRIINASSFTAGSNKSLTLENLTLQNSKTTGVNDTGGALFIRNAELTLNHSTISNNATEGITASGGGIFSNDLVILNSSTISGNSTIGGTARGGGIYAEDLNARYSTISGNTTTGFYASGSGALVNNNARVYNSTISSNSISGVLAQGGGLLVGSKTFLFNSTVYANTSVTGAAGLSVIMGDDRYVTLTNTILSGNTNTGDGASPEGNFNDRASLPTAIINSNHSIFGDDASEITGINTNTIFNNNPNLGPLLDNGGLVLTHFPNDLSNTSLVIDQGNTSLPTASYDQRGSGFVRIADGTVDIGAVEVQTTTPSVVTNTNDSGAGSLRQAVIYTNNSSALNTVDLSAFTPNQTITLNSELNITDTVTISGPTIGDAGSLILDGNNSTRIINATTFPNNSGKTVTLENITLQNGNYVGTATGPDAQGGAAIAVKNADLTLNNTLISNNKTTGYHDDGGGIFVRNGNAVITQSVISGNSTEGHSAQGGGMRVQGDLTLTDSTVSGNSTTGSNAQGGGFHVYLGYVSLNQSTVSGNSTTGSRADGGGFYANYGYVSLNQSTVSGNSTTGSFADGGGFYFYNGNVTLTQSTVSGNSTTGFSAEGGGFYVFDGNVSLNQSTISHNTANSAGAGIYFDGHAYGVTKIINLNLNNTVLSNNRSNQLASNLILSLKETDDLNGNIGNIILNVNANHNLLGTDVIARINNDSDANLVTNTATIENDNPGLGPLQNNGGPTLTKAPISGSLVINAGSNTIANNQGFMEDQRGLGFPRIADTTVDIGAVEAPILPNKNNLVKRAEIVKPILLAAGLEPLATNSNVYQDVAANSFNATWINRFKSEGLTMGCDTNKFCPDNVVSKEELAKMIVQAKGLNPTTPTGIFSDVPTNAFNADYIESLIDEEFTEGCAVTPDRYCPKEAVTIEVFNNILNKAFK